MTSADRLAAAVTALAQRVAEPEVRTQLHALAGVVANLDVAPPRDADADEGALHEAMAAGNESEVVRLARRIAAAERARVKRVDWSAASGG